MEQADLLLGPFSFRDVFVQREDVVHLAVVPADAAYGDVGIHHAAVPADEPLFHGKLIDLAVQHLSEVGQVPVEIVGMRHFGPRHPRQLLTGVAQHPLQAGIGLQPFPFRRCYGHPDHLPLEEKTGPFFACFQIGEVEYAGDISLAAPFVAVGPLDETDHLDHVPGFGEVAFLQRVALHLVPHHAPMPFQAHAHVIGMRYVGVGPHVDQFLLLVAEQSAEGFVHLHEFVVGSDGDDAEKGVVEERTVARFALAHGQFGLIALLFPAVQLLGHVVEGSAQFPQFPPLDAVRNPDLQVTSRQAPRCLAQNGDPVDDGALADQPGEQ